MPCMVAQLKIFNHVYIIIIQEDDFFLWKVDKIKKRRNLRTKEERKKIHRLA